MKSNEGLTTGMKKILEKIPYGLIPTNIPTVFATAPAEERFNPDKATRSELIKNGILWRRPEKGDDPILLTAWQKAFSKPLRAEDRIVPYLVPRVRKRRHPGKEHFGGEGNPSWAGCALSAPGNWYGVMAYWIVPTVSEPMEPQGEYGGGWYSSTWIGIDGAGSATDVLQAGTDQNVDTNGKPSYSAWFEWYTPVNTLESPPYIAAYGINNFAVNAGDLIYCSVQYILNKTMGQITLVNYNSGAYFTVNLLPPPGVNMDGQTVEWILEASNGGYPYVALPNFTPVQFTTALGCAGPGETIAGNPINGFLYDMAYNGQFFTATTVANNEVTIEYIGP